MWSLRDYSFSHVIIGGMGQTEYLDEELLEGKRKLERQVIYHDYNPPTGYNKNINNPWGKGRVIRITIAGNYYD